MEGLEKIFVNDKQVEYEFSHLMNKLKVRDIEKLNKIIKEKEEQNKKYKINLHSIFKIKKVTLREVLNTKNHHKDSEC